MPYILASDPTLGLYIFGTEKIVGEFFESTFKNVMAPSKLPPLALIKKGLTMICSFF